MKLNVRLEEALQSFGYETGEEYDPAVLKRFIVKFPHFEKELMEFAASLALRKYAPESQLTDEEERYWRSFGRQEIRDLLLSRKKKTATITSLTRLAEERDMDKTAFASALGISISLLIYLEKRRLQAASIPGQFVSRIAKALRTTEESVAAYLRGGPEMSTQASFKAEGRPRSGAARDFLEVVNEDPGLTDDQKQELLSLE